MNLNSTNDFINYFHNMDNLMDKREEDSGVIE